MFEVDVVSMCIAAFRYTSSIFYRSKTHLIWSITDSDNPDLDELRRKSYRSNAACQLPAHVAESGVSPPRDH